MRPTLLALLAVAWCTRADAAGRAGATWQDRIVAAGGKLTQALGLYVLGRAADALDIVEANVGVGPGLKAGLEYGVLRTTLGYVEAGRLGIDGRQLGAWTEYNVAFGIFPASVLFAPFELVKNQGDTWKALAEVGFELGSVGVERTKRSNFATTAVLYREAVMVGPYHQRVGDSFSFGAELHLLLLGARARVKPIEAIDFLLGFVGVDLDPKLGMAAPPGGVRR